MLALGGSRVLLTKERKDIQDEEIHWNDVSLHTSNTNESPAHAQGRIVEQKPNLMASQQSSLSLFFDFFYNSIKSFNSIFYHVLSQLNLWF